MDDSSYEKTSLNSVQRYRNRGRYTFEQVNEIIDKTPILHVSFPPSLPRPESNEETHPYPSILPMIGCSGNFSSHGKITGDSARSIYLHGYVSARIMRLASATGGSPKSGGMPVSVAATLLDGIVLALTPNHHSCNYRSAIAFGHAHIVTDEAERLWAMELITDNLVPGRWAATRHPSAAEKQSTGILRVDVDSASVKVRTGTTGEDRRDLGNQEMRRRVWAGVVPAYMVWGEPVPAPTNMMGDLPQYLESWRRQESEEAKIYASFVAHS